MRDGRVQRAATDEVDTSWLGGQRGRGTGGGGGGSRDQVLGAQAHGEGLRLNDHARILFHGPGLGYGLEVGAVGGRALVAPGAGGDVGDDFGEVEVEA